MKLKPHHGHDHHHDVPVPGVMLNVAGALVLFSLIGVAFVSLTGIGRQDATPTSLVVDAREVRFDDLPGGEVLVRDAATNAVIEQLAVGEGGFVRASLRGLVRRHDGSASGDDATFRIERRENGQLLLVDTTGDATVDLWAFGPDNAAAFARYLDTATVPMRSAQETH
ncbi:MAG: photosynthetic complex assembly protein PuhC [Pseudomonadota bacterium]